MRVAMRRRERRVFFSEAIRRVLQQRPRKQFQSIPVLLRAALSELGFVIRNFLPLIPSHLNALKHRAVFDGYEVYGGECRGPLVVFVHGGAWGSGSASLHATVGMRLSRALGSPIVVADQRVWPNACMSEQARQVGEIVRKAQVRFSGRPSVLVAHSSGAHSAAWALADGVEVDVAVLQAGVYEPLLHYVHEGARCVESVSPMAPAANADADVRRLADVAITARLRGISSFSSPNRVQVWSRKHGLKALLPSSRSLEGRREASCLVSNETNPATTVIWGAMNTFVMAATEDIVVPLSSNIRFMRTLNDRGIPAQLLVYSQTSHADFVLNWARSSKHKMEGILDIDDCDRKRRMDAYAAAYGKEAARLKEEELGDEVPVASHARDLFRIVRSIAHQSK